MEEADGLAYDDPQSDSDATVKGRTALKGLNCLCIPNLWGPCLTPRGVPPLAHWGHLWNTCCRWSLQSWSAVKVHMDEEELDGL